MFNVIIIVLFFVLALSNFALWMKTAYLTGMCESLVLTVKEIVKEIEENG